MDMDVNSELYMQAASIFNNTYLRKYYSILLLFWDYQGT